MAEFLDKATTLINSTEMNRSSQRLSHASDKTKKYEKGSKSSYGSSSTSSKSPDPHPPFWDTKTNILLMLEKQNKVLKRPHPIVHKTNKGMNKFCNYHKNRATTPRVVGAQVFDLLHDQRWKAERVPPHIDHELAIWNFKGP